MNQFQAVFFDLDGTLVDTAPDMVLALNLLLIKYDLKPFEFNQLRPYVSHGSSALIKAGFDIDESDDQFIELRDQFLQLYEQNIAVGSNLFDGMEIILENLERSQIPWGIVTNKPGYLTDKLLIELDLSKRAVCVISGDSLTLKKPHPEPLFVACKQSSCIPEQCLYIGDAERDIQAARAAGMTSCAALYGYYTDQENPQHWDADFYINSADDLHNHIIF